jgi:CDP-glucose 4,6-dehydratase
MNWKSYQKYFKGKKILITGNSGFVGSYLSLTLSLFGSKILGYSLKKKDNRYLSNFSDYKRKIKTINDDIKNIESYQRTIIKFKPDILIHLASQPLVSESYIKTKSNYETNVMGTVKLFEIAKKLTSLKNIIIFTSDKVYKNLEKKSLNESSPLGGEDPYSASKSAQDLISNSYKLSFFKKNKNVFLVRAGNIIGGGDWEKSRLIPDLFLSNLNKKKIYLRNPNATRPWQHILDVVEGILRLIAVKGKKISENSLVYNIGPKSNKSLKVKLLIKEFINSSDFIKIKFKFKNIHFNEKKFLKLSSKSIMKDIKWQSKLKIEDAIKLTSKWYFEFFKNKKQILNYTIQQIYLFLK